MTDLHPGMTVEVSTAFTALPDISSRPAWLSRDAVWPPVPGGVMYKVSGTSAGFCDECVISCYDAVEEYSSICGGAKVVQVPGDEGWYCTCSKKGSHGGDKCRRWWDRHEYRARRY